MENFTIIHKINNLKRFLSYTLPIKEVPMTTINQPVRQIVASRRPLKWE